MMDDGHLFMACSSFGDDNDSFATAQTGLTGHGHTTIFGMWASACVGKWVCDGSFRAFKGFHC
jgi:hypothetical protein